MATSSRAGVAPSGSDTSTKTALAGSPSFAIVTRRLDNGSRHQKRITVGLPTDDCRRRSAGEVGPHFGPGHTCVALTRRHVAFHSERTGSSRRCPSSSSVQPAARLQLMNGCT